MPIKDLLAGECGGSNALVRASDHLTRTRDRNHQEILRPLHHDHFAGQLQGATSSLQHGNVFKMDALLDDMQRIDRESFLQSRDARAEGAVSGLYKQWSLEFGAHEAPKMSSVAQANWAQEYLNHSSQAMQPSFNQMGPSASWNRPNLLTSPYFRPGPMMMAQGPQLQQQLAYQQLEQMHHQATLAEEARLLMASSKTDNELYSTEFLDFVDKIAQEKITLSDTEMKEEAAASAAQEKPKVEEKDDLEFWNYLANEWDQMAKEDNDAYSWLDYEPAGDIYNEYYFTDENPYKEAPNALEEGLKKLREGDIPSAVLLFEAACQQEPENATAWQLLGTTQAKNEHDPAAIRAIKKSLQLDPTNLTSLMALAVSYTNESLQKQACDALGQWLRSNPTYSDIASQMPPPPTEAQTNPLMISSIASSAYFNQIKDAFIKAARKLPSNLDPDVQSGLGVLFNLSGEYPKAIDCFQAALQSRPDDALLWNRLGATLANGDRSEEAVAAYRKALEISPGFIRSRFNLGISCVNLGAHREAVQHFLAVLNFQNAGRGPQGQSSKTVMSNNVWSSLRMVLSLLGRQDLYEKVERRDLTSLNQEFNIQT